MSRESDPSWVALVDEMIRRKVDAGDTDQEIRDAMVLEWFDWAELHHINSHLRYLRLVGTSSESHGFTERQIRAAAAKVRETTDRAPTLAQVAAALHTSESTLKRAMKERHMGSWPPAPPED